ncbi:hypothetical protein [Alicyclobacillus fodiniaquatilis]|uniref:Photosynthesis system II assembly factor Ycf48/Hcf136-like domain-containing protein n=1 Tax=Alicyclobacillus fodiniaquatilis TaxID=1661150 RepID=A0ABW4JM51_9BACL
MRLSRSFATGMALAIFMGATGCGTANNQTGALVSKSMTSSKKTSTSGWMLHKPEHPGIPATVRLNSLERSNSWYTIDMASNEIGYRWGFLNGHFAMERTEDGGQNWNSVALPMTLTLAQMTPGNGQLINPNVQILDETTVYMFAVSGHQLIALHSADGGSHFSTKRLPLATNGLRIESVNLLGDTDGWILLRGSGQDAATHLLYHLTNAATKATSQHVTAGATDAGLPASAQAVVRFTNPKDGWLLATATDGKLRLYATADGGATWRMRNLAAPSELDGYKAARVYTPVILEQEGTFVVRYTRTGAQSPVKTVVFRSRDRGVHFTGQIVNELNDAMADYTGQPVFFATPDYGWSISDARLVMTRDSGTSWKTIHAPGLETTLHSYPRVLALDFVSDLSGFVLLQSQDYRKTQLLHTDDEGSSWSVVQS